MDLHYKYETGKLYVTTKIVIAWLEKRDNEDGYKVKYPDGYISWCPKDVFEKTSRAIGDEIKEVYRGTQMG